MPESDHGPTECRRRPIQSRLGEETPSKREGLTAKLLSSLGSKAMTEMGGLRFSDEEAAQVESAIRVEAPLARGVGRCKTTSACTGS